MSDFSLWMQNARQALAQSLDNLGAYLPYLLAALALMLVGWLVARILRAVLFRLGRVFNNLVARLARATMPARLKLSPGVIALLGNVVFWVTILVFAALAARVARLDAFSAGLDRVVAYLPALVAGGLIVLAGFLVSMLVRDIVTTALGTAKVAQNDLFGYAAQGAVFLTAVVIGLDQIGVDVTLLIILLAVLAGGTALSLAIAFGIGARDFVGNLIASHQAQRELEPGERARFGEAEGRILEFTPTSVVLLTDEGRMLVPAKLLQQQATLIVAGDEDE